MLPARHTVRRDRYVLDKCRSLLMSDVGTVENYIRQRKSVLEINENSQVVYKLVT